MRFFDIEKTSAFWVNHVEVVGGAGRDGFTQQEVRN